jgi:hypothetical protein
MRSNTKRQTRRRVEKEKEWHSRAKRLTAGNKRERQEEVRNAFIALAVADGEAEKKAAKRSPSVSLENTLSVRPSVSLRLQCTQDPSLDGFKGG